MRGGEAQQPRPLEKSGEKKRENAQTPELTAVPEMFTSRNFREGPTGG